MAGANLQLGSSLTGWRFFNVPDQQGNKPLMPSAEKRLAESEVESGAGIAQSFGLTIIREGWIIIRPSKWVAQRVIVGAAVVLAHLFLTAV